MSEYREALQSLIDDINFFCPKKFNGVQSFTDAKALLARGEPDKQGDLLRLLALRGYKIDEADEIARLVFSSEPAAAEKARELASKQANDDGLWFSARTAAEAYLQQELRRLHRIIEG